MSLTFITRRALTGTFIFLWRQRAHATSRLWTLPAGLIPPSLQQPTTFGAGAYSFGFAIEYLKNGPSLTSICSRKRRGGCVWWLAGLGSTDVDITWSELLGRQSKWQTQLGAQRQRVARCPCAQLQDICTVSEGICIAG